MERASAVPEWLIDVLQRCDELATLQQLDDSEYRAELNRLIELLETKLAEIPDPSWQLRWQHSSQLDPA